MTDYFVAVRNNLFLVFLVLAMLVCAGLSNPAYFDPSEPEEFDEGIDLLLGTAIGTFIFCAPPFYLGIGVD